MTLAAVLRHLTFAAGLALLSAAAVRLMIGARADGPAGRPQGTRPADPEGRRRRHRRGVPGRDRRAVPASPNSPGWPIRISSA